MIIFRGQHGRFFLDDRAGQLWRGTPGRERVHLPRKQWNLLRYFVENPGKLISKAEIQENIWGGDNTHVSEASVSRAISDLRRALGDRAADPIFIEVVHGRGYRFVAVIDNEGGSTSDEVSDEQSELLDSEVAGSGSEDSSSNPEARPLNTDLGSGKIRPKRQRAPDKYTCDQMSENIRRQLMGPFPTARPLVFQAVENCVNSDTKLSLGALVEAAVHNARTLLGESAQPWAAIRAVTEKQLLRSGAVLDERGHALPDEWSSKTLLVHRLAENWRSLAEAEILLALFGAQDVTGAQLMDIARSVWGASSAEAVSKAHIVLQLLIASGRVQEDDRGVFRVKGTSAKG
jgi:DNA-binding winged helix-turn-helix (wHTH) protein